MGKFELLMSANRQLMKHIKQRTKKSQVRAGGKNLHIPVGNLVLFRDPEVWNKIQHNYNSKLFVIASHCKDPNVYVVQPINRKGPKRQSTGDSCLTGKKSQEDPTAVDSSIKGPRYKSKLRKITKPQVCHWYSTRSKAKAAPVYTKSLKTKS